MRLIWSDFSYFYDCKLFWLTFCEKYDEIQKRNYIMQQSTEFSCAPQVVDLTILINLFHSRLFSDIGGDEDTCFACYNCEGNS